ncbi:MAG: carboxypeptidase-like regulatory domain-containing protein [Candidatus Azobacteroides sp.]|nr:carboxypeptidase-like regulatory domain-containing protein [Candidatus Azobacteroides sp.]
MKSIPFILIFSIFFCNIFSQITINGRIVDINEISIPYANVIFLDKDSSYLYGTTSNNDGYFELLQPNNNYYMYADENFYWNNAFNLSTSLSSRVMRPPFYALNNNVNYASYYLREMGNTNFIRPYRVHYSGKGKMGF